VTLPIRRYLSVIGTVVLTVFLVSCGTIAGPPPKNYAPFRAESPRSILVVPVLNNTSNVTAPDFFLSTITRPFAERGYYVFPAYMVKKLLQDNGLSDPGLVHSTDPRRLARIFGCDTVLLVDIQQWDSKYVVISTTTTVKFDYTLKSCKSGATLWAYTQTMQYTPQAGNSGNLLADLISQAVVSAIEKGMPNYMPLAVQANAIAAGTVGQGLPAGPYLPSVYGADEKQFPSHP
jgi:hypothetical protein